jgi:ankyrin repeat protein
VTVTAIAAIKDQPRLLKLLAQYGARFDIPNALGWTPLVLAMKNDSWQAASYLATEQLECKERHTWRDRDGNSTMHFVSHLRSGLAGKGFGLFGLTVIQF